MRYTSGHLLKRPNSAYNLCISKFMWQGSWWCMEFWTVWYGFFSWIYKMCSLRTACLTAILTARLRCFAQAEWYHLLSTPKLLDIFYKQDFFKRSHSKKITRIKIHKKMPRLPKTHHWLFCHYWNIAEEITLSSVWYLYYAQNMTANV